MKLTFRYHLGAGLLAAAAFAGCSAIERGINQFERGFDDEAPSSGFLPGVYAEPLTEADLKESPAPFAVSVQAPARLNTQGREPRPTDFLIEPQDDVPALVPPPAPAPLPIDGQPAAFRGNAGQIRPICFNSSSCCPSVVSCDPCSTSCCSSGCGESLLSRMHRGISNTHGRMHCFKARVKSKLSRLNPFSCSSCCDPCATCCDPCASCCIPSCDPCCDPCGNGVILAGAVVGSYPVTGGATYGGHVHGYSQPSYPQGVYAPQAQGYYAAQAPCNCQHGSTWQPQQQFTQAPAWQQYAAPQQYFAPQQYAQPYYQGQPSYAQPQQQYAAPQYQQQPVPQQQYSHPQYSHPGQPNTQIPPTVQPLQRGAIQHGPIQQGPVQHGPLQPGAVQPGAVQPSLPAPPHPVPATSQTPGTALLGPGYAPRTVPVTRHLQTTYQSVR